MRWRFNQSERSEGSKCQRKTGQESSVPAANFVFSDSEQKVSSSFSLFHPLPAWLDNINIHGIWIYSLHIAVNYLGIFPHIYLCCVLPWCLIFPGFAPISDGSVYKLIIYREQEWEYRSTMYRAIDNCIVFTISWSMESSIKSIDNIFLKCFCGFFRRKVII